MEIFAILDVLMRLIVIPGILIFILVKILPAMASDYTGLIKKYFIKAKTGKKSIRRPAGVSNKIRYEKGVAV